MLKKRFAGDWQPLSLIGFSQNAIKVLRMELYLILYGFDFFVIKILNILMKYQKRSRSFSFVPLIYKSALPSYFSKHIYIYVHRVYTYIDIFIFIVTYIYIYILYNNNECHCSNSTAHLSNMGTQGTTWPHGVNMCQQSRWHFCDWVLGTWIPSCFCL